MAIEQSDQVNLLFYAKGWSRPAPARGNAAMPGDPKERRDRAARCAELAKIAENPEHARVLANLARQWRRLARQLGRSQAVLNARNPLHTTREARRHAPTN